MSKDEKKALAIALILSVTTLVFVLTQLPSMGAFQALKARVAALESHSANKSAASERIDYASPSHDATGKR